MQEKEYYTLDETAEYFGKTRATVYNKMRLIGMKGHKFKGDRKTYLSQEEVKKLRNVFEKPWTVNEKEESVA